MAVLALAQPVPWKLGDDDSRSQTLVDCRESVVAVTGN